jgi:hypothetical protein
MGEDCQAVRFQPQGGQNQQGRLPNEVDYPTTEADATQEGLDGNVRIACSYFFHACTC